MRFYAPLVAVVAGVFAAGAARAESISILAGDYVRLSNGPGNSPGGEFIANKQMFNGSAWVDSSVDWATFCLETTETFSYGELLKVAGVTGYATNGGSGGQVSPGIDPISNETAWLYTQFSNGTLVGLNGAGTAVSGSYLSNQVSNATYLQQAIWLFENESLGSNNYYWTLAHNAVAGGWTNSAGYVQVVNLEKWNGSSWVKSQDQLVYSVPEPASLALIGAGLAAIGAAKRRRRRLAP